MLPTRIHPTFRLKLAATAAVIAAGCVYSSLTLAASGSIGDFDESSAVQAPAVNRNAIRVDDADRASQGFGYRRVAAGSGLTPVSAEVRGGPRVDQDAPMRAGGSIRADIARYNEERSVPHPAGRQADEPRSPTNAAYRN
jgi:hypothetical protein